MPKCETCSREFCSSFNLRRHAQVHTRAYHRSFNVMEHQKNREELSAYWDKLSPEKAKEVISFNDAMLLKGLSGSTVIKALASTLCKPGGLWNLPQAYVKGGSTLLDIVHSKPSEPKISSKELFSALDDASERTFLWAGAVDFEQTYLFNQDDAGGCLKLKNIISTASLLFERQLMKAWFGDKEAEAMRFQNQLVEEEEAAQKRQAAVSEKKRQKKLRQKEQKLKEQPNESPNVEADSVDTPALVQESAPPPSPDSKPDLPDLSTNGKGPTDKTENKDQENSQDNEFKVVGARNGQRRSAPVLRQAIRSQRYRRIKFSDYRQNVPKQNVWVKKPTVANGGEGSSKPSPLVVAKEEDKFQLMIGSIPIPLRRVVSKLKDEGATVASKPQENARPVLMKENPEKLIKTGANKKNEGTVACKPQENPKKPMKTGLTKQKDKGTVDAKPQENPRHVSMKENPEKPMKTGNSPVGSKQWRPVSHSGTKSSLLPVDRKNKGMGSGQSRGENLRGNKSSAV